MNTVNEQEINMVREIFEKMANAVIDMSRASNDIAALRSEIESLKEDVRVVRDRNRELDAEVAEVRRQRDEAVKELERVRQDAAGDHQMLVDTEHALKNVRRDLETAQADLVQARRDRDDASYKNLEYVERAEKAEKALATVKEAVGCNERTKTSDDMLF